MSQFCGDGIVACVAKVKPRTMAGLLAGIPCFFEVRNIDKKLKIHY